MIAIFDMDDTLYDEVTYVQSGFRAVASFIADSFGLDASELVSAMHHHLATDGRGTVFDDVLLPLGLCRPELIEQCVAVYRSHVPEITLFPEARGALNRLSGQPVFVVTDGHPLAQQTKALSLGLNRMVAGVVLTSAFGTEYEKPSVRCFEMIARRQGVTLADLCYVGDNPSKDFVGLNEAGAMTIRVLTGAYADVVAAAGFDAAVTIPDLSHFDHAMMSG